MIRALAIVFAVAAGGAVAATLSQAYAQSPDPARLAPGSSRSVLTPRPSIPHTGVAPRPSGATRSEVIHRRSRMVGQRSRGRR
jgi:hypothetical protein